MPFEQYRTLSTTPPEPPEPPKSVLQLLLDRRDLIRRIATISKIDSVAVFGSVATGNDSETSDIDLLVAPSATASLFDLAQFEIDMAALTGRKVDVVSRRALDPERDMRIITEAIEL